MYVPCGPCDYCVSLSSNNWISGFLDLVWNLGSGFGACWDWRLSLSQLTDICGGFITLSFVVHWHVDKYYQDTVEASKGGVGVGSHPGTERPVQPPADSVHLATQARRGQDIRSQARSEMCPSSVMTVFGSYRSPRSHVCLCPSVTFLK